ncbi:MAG TPA: ABC transporter ATP-binding protein [Thermomicrobiales bacterium]|nr:ABC transporter ATP-binding protein [Thermomicrobiales bacterium]
MTITDSHRQGSAIDFEQVSKEYPGAPRPAVADVSLTIEPGRFVALLGPSGCGKTTLLKMVNRLHEPTSGRILIDGADIESFAAPALRRQIGYVIQQTGLFPHMRIEENVAVVPSLLGWDKRRTSERIDELLELVGLPPDDYRRRYPAQLSGGEQQRVGLARALAAEPSTMLMDEPFGALDAITRTRLQGELLQIHGRMGQTILFVTHDIEEAVRLADQIVVMREGRVVQFDTPLRIVMQPADDFVADLVGANDVLRRLSLIRVADVLQPVDIEARETIPADADLRAALAQLMEQGTTSLAVVDNNMAIVGSVNLGTIEQASKPAEPVASA